MTWLCQEELDDSKSLTFWLFCPQLKSFAVGKTGLDRSPGLDGMLKVCRVTPSMLDCKSVAFFALVRENVRSSSEKVWSEREIDE